MRRKRRKEEKQEKKWDKEEEKEEEKKRRRRKGGGGKEYEGKLKTTGGGGGGRGGHAGVLPAKGRHQLVAPTTQWKTLPYPMPEVSEDGKGVHGARAGDCVLAMRQDKVKV